MVFWGLERFFYQDVKGPALQDRSLRDAHRDRSLYVPGLEDSHILKINDDKMTIQDHGQ